MSRFGLGSSKISCFGGRERLTLQTDHASLAHINKAKLTNSRILRWSLILQEHRFKVEAIKGTLNVCADYLSRLD